ncbi:MAG: DUF4384 domain-containing protein [Gemmatimonadota bacterium]
MRFGKVMFGLVALAVVGSNSAETAWALQDYGNQDYEVYPVEARVWLDRGAEPVLQRGERARIYYRVSESAFVAIFHIDTNGTSRLVFPSSPQENHYARGGRDYRVLLPGSTYWYVNEDPGVGYFFIVASPEPFDFRDFNYSHYAGGWDLSLVGRQVYGDPYLAMDDYVAALIPDWEYVGYGLDFTSYHVERHHDYPRFLCYDCHGFQPYYSWNPYAYSCTSFRVVVYSDPYYYPATRYRGTRVVYVQPRRGIPRYGFKERAVGEAGTPSIVVRNTPPVGQPGVEGTQNRRAVPRSSAPSAFNPGGTSGNPPGTAGVQRPGVESGSNRRSGTSGGNPSASTGRPSAGQSGSASSTRPSPRTILTDPGGARGSTAGATRPSSRVVRPGGRVGTTTPPSATTRSRPTVSSGGSSTRGSPTVTRGGATTRSSPTVRSGGSSTRTVPTVRSGGATTRTVPTVRSGGGSTTTRPTVRTTGSSGGAKPRTSRPRTPPKVRKPGGGSFS